MIYFDAAYIAKCYLNEPAAGLERTVVSGRRSVVGSLYSGSVFRNSTLAPKVRREGSQTCNVWTQANYFRALEERQIFLPRLQRGIVCLTVPDVSHLATFFEPLRGKKQFLNKH